jgi:hypothetical protein
VERHWARRISFVANKFSKEEVELQTYAHEEEMKLRSVAEKTYQRLPNSSRAKYSERT